jgi:hypothetical protein
MSDWIRGWPEWAMWAFLAILAYVWLLNVIHVATAGIRDRLDELIRLLGRDSDE